MNILLIFSSTFIFLLAIGMQTQTASGGHYRGAFLSSLLVAVTQLGSLRVINSTNPWEYAAYLLGAPLGMVTSMYIHRRFFRPPVDMAETLKLALALGAITPNQARSMLTEEMNHGA